MRPALVSRKGSVAAATDNLQQRQMLSRPAYVFRGHGVAVHVARILRRNLILLTGDADGWVVLWNLVSRRPVVVWRAHQTALLGAAEWGDEKIITHGRDSKLCVWQFLPGEENSNAYSSILPIDEEGIHEDHPKPRLLHCLTVNTLNFCPFSISSAQMEERTPPPTPDLTASYIQRDMIVREQELSSPISALGEMVFIAVPSTQEGQIDIYQLPSEQWVTRIPKPKSDKGGIVMQVHLHEDTPLDVHFTGFVPLVVIAGYEDGSTSVFIGYRIAAYPVESTIRLGDKDNLGKKWVWHWNEVYTSCPHGAPVIGLDVAPRIGKFFTSGADNVVAMHDLPKPQASQPTLSTAISAPVVHQRSRNSSETAGNPPSLLSQAFKSAAAQETNQTPKSSTGPHPSNNSLNQSEPLRRLVTEFTGQQDICLRSPDYDVVATAGWDGAVHVYGTKALTHLDDFNARFLSNGVDSDDAGGGWSSPAPASALSRNPENPGRTNGFMTVSFSQIVNNIVIQDDYTPLPHHPIVDYQDGGVNRHSRGSMSGNTQEPISVPTRSIPTVLQPTSFMDASPTTRAPIASIRDRHQLRVQKSSWIVAGSKDGRALLWEIPEARLKRE